MKIRPAVPQDAADLLDIYSYYVEKTDITFEYDVPSEEEFRSRILSIEKRYPYLVAVDHDSVLGYAYASSFKDRRAYDWACETTVYVRRGIAGRGIGTALYEELERLLKKQNIQNLNACIAYPNPKSEIFHLKNGFRQAAHFSKCGYKLDKWIDMIWMEKEIGGHEVPPKPFVPYSRLDY